MQKLKTLLTQLREDESGATMIEYSVMVGLITIALIALIVAVSGQLVTIWTQLTGTLATIPAVGGGGGGGAT